MPSTSAQISGKKPTLAQLAFAASLAERATVTTTINAPVVGEGGAGAASSQAVGAQQPAADAMVRESGDRKRDAAAVTAAGGGGAGVSASAAGAAVVEGRKKLKIDTVQQQQGAGAAAVVQPQQQGGGAGAGAAQSGGVAAQPLPPQYWNSGQHALAENEHYNAEIYHAWTGRWYLQQQRSQQQLANQIQAVAHDSVIRYHFWAAHHQLHANPCAKRKSGNPALA